MNQSSAGKGKSSSRMKVLGHILALLGMLLITRLIFVPYLEEFEKIPGESSIHPMRLPDKTGNVRYEVNVDGDGRSIIIVNGWAFIIGEDAKAQEVFIVLKSEDRVYVFNTMTILRPDVTEKFQDLERDLDLSGVRALIPARMIRNGEYQLGIYIRKDDREALSYSKTIIVKFHGLIYNELESKQVDLELPEETGNILSKIESIKDIGRTFKLISGWAFIEGLDTEDNEIYLVLKSDRRTYFLAAEVKTRKDITKSFQDTNLNLDNSGFDVFINVTKRKGIRIRSDQYRLGIYIRKGDVEAFSFTDKIVRKTRWAMEVVN